MAEEGRVKFLADENLSPVLVQILRKLDAGFIESMHGKPELGTRDDHWIPIYASRGYVILSCDRKQLTDAAIARAIAGCGARMIYLPSKFADMKRWDQALWMLKTWWKIVERARAMNAGELVVFAANGRSREA